jgi:hypothetical protein
VRKRDTVLCNPHHLGKAVSVAAAVEEVKQRKAGVRELRLGVQKGGQLADGGLRLTALEVRTRKDKGRLIAHGAAVVATGAQLGDVGALRWVVGAA